MDELSSSPAPKVLRWSGSTDRGVVRANNEDAFVGMRFDAREVHYLGKLGDGETGRHDYAFAVSDGMGGAMAGEYASQIAVEKITALLPRAYRQSAAGMETGFSDILEELFARVHSDLRRLGSSYEECSGMEATLSLCWFTPEWMYFGHVGDSRIYFVSGREGRLKQLSHDDTYVGWLFRNGKLNEREARNHPRRNVLQKALGGGNQFVSPQVGAVGYESGDVFLICSDGLVEGLHYAAIEELLSPVARASLERPDQISSKLIQEALARDGRDNLTALVVEVL